MKRVIHWLAGALLSLTPVLAQGIEIEPIPADHLKLLTQAVLEQAAKIDQPQVKIDGAVDQANGYHVPQKLGAAVVPQKELKETAELAEKFKSDPGASLAYLFTYHLIPVIDGQQLAADKLRTVELTDGQGKTHTLHVWLLAVRQLAEGDYRLHVYGKDGKPLVDVPFAQANGPNEHPVVVELKDPNQETRQGKMVFTVFGKYQASFTAAYTGE